MKEEVSVLAAVIESLSEMDRDTQVRLIKAAAAFYGLTEDLEG